MDQKYIMETSPHIRSKINVSSIMLDVIISLLPALFVSIYVFGIRALYVTLVSISVCLVSEYLFTKITKRSLSINNLSVVVTGILFAFCLPPQIPYALVCIGAFVSIILGKCIFGGLGFNPFNPALVGRAFLLASWPSFMTTWVKPFFYKEGVDVITSATPLAIIKMNLTDQLPSYMNMFLGIRSGSIGEISIIALLIGALYLVIRGVIKLYIPLSFILTVGLLSIIFHRDPIFHILAGGLILGAFFMATDYSTSPMLPIPQIIFGIGCGVITVLIRFWGGFPEGVCYAILIMNCLTPMLDKIKLRKYGEK
jgi:Na+-translocating ferredoxin:NAD+ oxidoreductase subunit D